MAIFRLMIRLTVFLFVCEHYKVSCMPEQGVQILNLLPIGDTDTEVIGGFVKSMYNNSLLSANITCTKGGGKISLTWVVKTQHCADMTLMDTGDLDIMLDRLTRDEVLNENFHYLVFPKTEFTCGSAQSVTLPDYTNEVWKTVQITAVSAESGADTSDASSDEDDAKNADSENNKEEQKPRSDTKEQDLDLASERSDTKEQDLDLASDRKKQKNKLKSSSNTEVTEESIESRPDKSEKEEQKSQSTKQKRDTGSTKDVNKTMTVSVNNDKIDTKSRTQSSVTGAIPKVPADGMSSVTGAILKVPADGIYLFILKATYDKPQVNVSVTMKAVSSYGYLSAIDFPLLPFYAVMCALYSIFLLIWLILCCYYRKDILQIQLWIGAVLFIGFVDEASFLGEYHTLNQTGQSVPGAIIFGEFVWCIKRAMSRMVVIIASIGFGITKPRLGPTLPKILAVGVVYVILGTIEGYNRATTHEANQQTRISLAFLLVLAVTDAAICWWIFTALVQTMRTLRLRRNLVKLSLYRHFTNTLIFSILASVAFMIWIIVQRQRTQSCITDWKELWVDDAFWHLLFSIILLVMLILWRPSASNQRYAYSPLSDGADNEAEEPMMNDAFEGMKMRGSKDSGNSHKHTSDQAEDDLKWIEDNIPSSVADSTLPSLLDSEEEIMTTKYELSKMQ